MKPGDGPVDKRPAELGLWDAVSVIVGMSIFNAPLSPFGDKRIMGRRRAVPDSRHSSNRTSKTDDGPVLSQDEVVAVHCRQGALDLEVGTFLLRRGRGDRNVLGDTQHFAAKLNRTRPTDSTRERLSGPYGTLRLAFTTAQKRHRN
jgi:hypothetical protein